MKKNIKLKALAIFVCSSMAGYAMADNNMNNEANETQNGQVITTTTPTNGENNGQVTQTTTIDNEALKKQVSTALADYSGKVEVAVKEGIIHLKGELPSDTDYEKVITVTESIKGVRDVNADNLTVKDSEQPMQDTYITAKVKGVLIREDVMGEDIPSWTVSVETKNGTVYLSGTVASDAEKQRVGAVANTVNGVEQVENQIIVGDVEPSNEKNGLIQSPENSEYDKEEKDQNQ